MPVPMKTKHILNFALLISMFIGMTSCNNKGNSVEIDPKIVSFDNRLAFAEFRKLNLDSSYTNLLNPANSTETEFEVVMESWTQMHQKVSKFIKEENFKWEVSDSTITINNRIYFDKDGTIDYYAFKIINPSVPLEKRRAYEKVLQKFSKQIKLDLPRDEKYAQCGKIRYLNY